MQTNTHEKRALISSIENECPMCFYNSNSIFVYNYSKSNVYTSGYNGSPVHVTQEECCCSPECAVIISDAIINGRNSYITLTGMHRNKDLFTHKLKISKTSASIIYCKL
ncbi:hypothetical protein NQD34_005364 [Periophthalmus magnuspinnatus]|nr:hypothetical protein NQD34_005364 [Periophthalmus magnuspinnatus]